MHRIGMDLVEIDRIRHSIKNPRFLLRVFGAREREELSARGNPAQSIAAAFAGKEAFSKALGTGICGFSMQEVEILHKESGQPYLHLSGRARALAGRAQLQISLTHTARYAAAVVLMEGEDDS